MGYENGLYTDRAGNKGVQGLAFVVYVHADHSGVSIKRHDYLPLRGNDLRLSHFNIDIGHQHLRGLSGKDAVRLVSWAIVVALSDRLDFADPGVATGAPEGATGGVVNIPLPGL